jgi:hypothetical protein
MPTWIMLFGFALSQTKSTMCIAILDKSKRYRNTKIINKISASPIFIKQEISNEVQNRYFKKGK